MITIDELADRVHGAFSAHRIQVDDMEDENGRPIGREVSAAVAEAAAVSPEVAADLCEILRNRFKQVARENFATVRPYANGSRYCATAVSGSVFEGEWTELENRLKTKARYFDPLARSLLSRVFQNLEALQTEEGDAVVQVCGPNRAHSGFFRARVFQRDIDLEEALVRPDLHLGPPPPRGASSGRMNARGIPVFYGAVDEDTAVCEVRPPVGSRVLVGRFDLLKDVRLLDIQSLKSVACRFQGESIFDDLRTEEMRRSAFLGTLVSRMTQPIMPDDEAYDYLITQVVAEYLAAEKGLDGILYPSAQVEASQLNVVLFAHAARVRPLEGITNAAQGIIATDINGKTFYSVFEDDDGDSSSLKTGSANMSPGSELPILQVIRHSLAVHQVRRVMCCTDRVVVRLDRQRYGSSDA